MRKITITDDDFIELTVDIAKAFPDEATFYLAFFSAVTAAEMFDKAEEEPTLSLSLS